VSLYSTSGWKQKQNKKKKKKKKNSLVRFSNKFDKFDSPFSLGIEIDKLCFEMHFDTVVKAGEAVDRV
jgi:hypothetical protein